MTLSPKVWGDNANNKQGNSAGDTSTKRKQLMGAKVNDTQDNLAGDTFTKRN